MDCHDVDAFLMERDNGEPIPAGIADHLENCARCRAEVARMNVMSQALAVDLDGGGPAIDTDLSKRIMAAIRDEVVFAPAGDAANPPTSLRNWIIVGSLLLAGLLGLRFSEVMNALRSAVGPAIDIAMSVILGLFLTGYICVLVASNLKRVQRLFRVRFRS